LTLVTRSSSAHFPVEFASIAMKRGTWLHCLLSGYLWLIAWIPLGSWNRQRGGTIITALLEGRASEAGDLGMLLFISLPAILFLGGIQKE
jgi:hypothetical protein